NGRSPSFGTTDHVQPKSLITFAEIRRPDAAASSSWIASAVAIKSETFAELGLHDGSRARTALPASSGVV
ncbi:hypothetical protein, partial [Burkholderia multivorans]|uniref:hypothetical protein n=1 Tax=Burkholderia multivorans TaxID=87883 RepID=UPI001C61625A